MISPTVGEFRSWNFYINATSSIIQSTLNLSFTELGANTAKAIYMDGYKNFNPDWSLYNSQILIAFSGTSFYVDFSTNRPDPPKLAENKGTVARTPIDTPSQWIQGILPF